ncbi:hypothetical protein [Streptococcus sp.]
MSDNQKNINPDNLSRVNGSFDVLSSELRNNFPDLLESSATETIQNASEFLEELAKEMKDTIDSLDKFLCNVGETFRNSDDSMANSIGQTMYTKAPETGMQRQERYIQGGKTTSDQHFRRKMVENTNSQFNDFPA